MLGPGFPVDYSLQLGVRNDARKWTEHTARRARVYPWEYMLGDKVQLAAKPLACHPPLTSLSVRAMCRCMQACPSS